MPQEHRARCLRVVLVSFLVAIALAVAEAAMLCAPASAETPDCCKVIERAIAQLQADRKKIDEQVDRLNDDLQKAIRSLRAQPKLVGGKAIRNSLVVMERNIARARAQWNSKKRTRAQATDNATDLAGKRLRLRIEITKAEFDKLLSDARKLCAAGRLNDAYHALVNAANNLGGVRHGQLSWAMNPGKEMLKLARLAHIFTRARIVERLKALEAIGKTYVGPARTVERADGTTRSEINLWPGLKEKLQSCKPHKQKVGKKKTGKKVSLLIRPKGVCVASRVLLEESDPFTYLPPSAREYLPLAPVVEPVDPTGDPEKIGIRLDPFIPFDKDYYEKLRPSSPGAPGSGEGGPAGDNANKPETPELPELGLVKAKQEVVKLAVADNATGKPIEGAQIRLTPDGPELPDLDKDKKKVASGDDFAPYRDPPIGGASDSSGAVVLDGEDKDEPPLDIKKAVDEALKAWAKYVRDKAAKKAAADNKKKTKKSAKNTTDKADNARSTTIMLKLPVVFDKFIVAVDKKAYRDSLGSDGHGGEKVVRNQDRIVKRWYEAMKRAKLHPVGWPVIDEHIYANPRVPGSGWLTFGVWLEKPEAPKKNTPDLIAKALKKFGIKTAWVEVDPCWKKEAVSNDPLYRGAGAWGQKFDNQWAIKRVGFTGKANSAWNYPAKDGGREVVVAVIDSGLDWAHPDIDPASLWRNRGEVAGNGIDDDNNGYVDDVIGWNFIDDDDRPWDEDGHGTFVTGVIAAARNNGVGIAGINKRARIMVLKALDGFGSGYASGVARAIVYAVDNGAEVINLSLGGGLSRLAQEAIGYARSRGVAVIAAAGNQATAAGSHGPAAVAGVITVAATDRRDRRAGFANWGPQVDIAAPGVDVLSLRARGSDLLAFIPGVEYERGAGIVDKTRAFYRASGTSFAVPIVTGTVSLILSRRPHLKADDAVRMVLNSARDIETPGIDNYTGYGLLDAAAAIRADPAYFVKARIRSAKVVRRQGKVYVRLGGTVAANEFASAEMWLGKGDTPKRWRRLSGTIKRAVSDGALADIPARLFAGAKKWTARVIVHHRDGSSREARFLLNLGG